MQLWSTGFGSLSHILIAGALATGATPALAAGDCGKLPTHADLRAALDMVLDGQNAGLGNEMWATVVDRDGVVCAVAFSGSDRDDQWPGSRVISAQKANTANAFSLEAGNGVGLALSSGNLYGTVQPGGSLFGLQHSNPVDTAIAYGGPNHTSGDAANYGQPRDPMVGEFIGGVNVFGGGLALYEPGGTLLGGLGVSGDTSCTDHIVAWRIRNALDLDTVPGGVADGTDNLIVKNNPKPNTFQHPVCGFGEEQVIENLPGAFPIS